MCVYVCVCVRESEQARFKREREIVYVCADGQIDGGSLYLPPTHHSPPPNKTPAPKQGERVVAVNDDNVLSLTPTDIVGAAAVEKGGQEKEEGGSGTGKKGG